MLIRYGGGWELNEEIKGISLITKLAGMSAKQNPAKNIFNTHGQRYEKIGIPKGSFAGKSNYQN